MTDDLRQILEQIQTGRLSVDKALEQLNSAAVADLGFAHVDLQRRQRCGLGREIVRHEQVRLGSERRSSREEADQQP